MSVWMICGLIAVVGVVGFALADYWFERSTDFPTEDK